MLVGIRLKSEDASGAQTLIQRLLAQDEENTTGRLMLIKILEKENELSRAEDEYKTLINQDIENDLPKLLLADFYNRTNRSKEAEKILQDLIAIRSDKLELRLYLARFYKEKEQNDAMVGVLEKAIEDMPDKYEPCEVLARHYLQTKAKDKGLEVLEQFMTRVRTGPDFLKAKFFMASIHYEDKKIDDALKLVEEVLKENPADVNAHSMKGSILAGRHDFVGAIAEYRAVLRQEPQNIPASLNLAKTHFLNNEAKLAEDTFKKILEINPKEKQARFGLADVYRQKGSCWPWAIYRL